jgi:protein-S-isoprenylcysteine O-methyltransferase Ste14
MNTAKTLLYMGVMHGFFTYYYPVQLAGADTPLFEPGLLRYAALALWLAGTLTILWCSADLVRKGRGTPAHLDPPKELVMNGPYRLVRNPIYAGAVLVQFGYILWFGSGWMILYTLFFMLAFHILIVLIEEPILKHSFGAAYDEYSKQVPRWIPKLR